MTANVLYDSDANKALLTGRSVAVMGFGSQGHAHALNLLDSGVDVVVGLRDGSSSVTKASEAGLKVMSLGMAATWAEVIVMLVPDTDQPRVYQDFVKPNLNYGDTLVFGHGLCINSGWIKPPPGVDVCLVAPKGPGHLVRDSYERGGGVPCLIAGNTDSARDLALAYACAIGAGRAGVLETSFQEETETDLFGEQTILVGGLVALIHACYEVLVEAGYQPEAAYFECIHELKLIADLVYGGGVSDMLYSISDTAKYGALTVGPTLFPDIKVKLREVLADIQSGRFATGWRAESDGGREFLQRLLADANQHPSEEVGARLRALMPFIGKQDLRRASGG